ncbi:hypothetical protein [Nonomuraea sp. NPDC050786]|uniref:hypothetical protein n=1 Tax=Nonomuraea sp. NPDC050786 TaxID=3154840 RepID=UPI0033C3D9AD
MELIGVGIPADVHDGYGLALVSVWVGLVVWCDGERYWFSAWLVGQRGTIVDVLRGGALALLELDNDASIIPNGVRRWSVHWDDLLLCALPSEPGEPEHLFVLGLSGTGHETVFHAVGPGTVFGVCGVPARPLPTCGWSLPFATRTRRACPRCVQIVETSP